MTRCIIINLALITRRKSGDRGKHKSNKNQQDMQQENKIKEELVIELGCTMKTIFVKIRKEKFSSLRL